MQRWTVNRYIIQYSIGAIIIACIVYSFSIFCICRDTFVTIVSIINLLSTVYDREEVLGPVVQKPVNFNPGLALTLG